MKNDDYFSTKIRFSTENQIKKIKNFIIKNGFFSRDILKIQNLL